LKYIHNKILKGLFYFDPDDLIYTNHFPQNPVVPGSIIVFAFIKAINNYKITTKNNNVHPNNINSNNIDSNNKDSNNKLSIEKFKFNKFITPGEYAYNIEINRDNFKCKLLKNNKTVASGFINNNNDNNSSSESNN
jgi:3-hydroxyacyl-[acyl-carrier-protein] dehydratase